MSDETREEVARSVVETWRSTAKNGFEVALADSYLALLDERDRLKAALEAHREALREALTLVRYSPPAQYDCGHNAQIDRIAAVLDKKP